MVKKRVEKINFVIPIILIAVILLTILIQSRITGYALFDIFKRHNQQNTQISTESNDNSIDGINKRLLNLNSNLNKAKEKDKKTIMGEMTKLSYERKEMMKKLIQDNPSLALQFAMSKSQKDNLPGSINQYIEEEVELTGDFEQMHIDDFKMERSKDKYFINEEGKKTSVYFGEEPIGVEPGETVRVKGIKLDGEVAAGKPVRVPSTVSVTGLTLVNGDSMTDVMTLSGGEVIDFNKSGVTKYLIRADTNPATVSYVAFNLGGSIFYSYSPPYTFVLPRMKGQYVLTATPYSGRNQKIPFRYHISTV